jgi:hypothetical protein
MTTDQLKVQLGHLVLNIWTLEQQNLDLQARLAAAEAPALPDELAARRDDATDPGDAA